MACITSFLLLPTVITTSSRELSSPSSRAFCSSSNLYGRFEKQNGRRKGFPAPIVQFLLVVFALLVVTMVVVTFEFDSGKHGCTFLANGIQAIGIKTQDLEDRRSYLSGFHKAVNGPSVDARVRYQQHDVGIIPCEPAVFGLLFVVSGIHHADVWNHDDIGSTRIAAFPQFAAGAGNVGNAGWVKDRVQ